MKTLLFIPLILMLHTYDSYCQNEESNKLLQEDLRYWFPIAVRSDVLIQTLKEGHKNYLIMPKKTNFTRPSTGEILPADTVIVVQLSRDLNKVFPGVFYYMYEGYCTGILYVDIFENLPKWQNVLKYCETLEPNHFVNKKIVHFVVSLSPKEGLIDIQIDVAM